MLTPGFVNTLNNIALAIGFSLSYDYYYVFVLNVVIFYFSVLCYSLSTVLQTPLNNTPNQSQSPLSPNLKESMLKESLRGNLE